MGRTEPRPQDRCLGHTYDYDNVHRRTRATLQDGSHWDYAYNDRNELTGGIHKWSDDMPVDGRTFGYGYDAIGNRLREQVGAAGPEARISEYTVNSLNQVTRRTVPGAVDVAGLAVSNATVTVNNLPVSRHGDYWHRAVGVDNDTGAAYPSLKAVAVQNNYGQEDEDIVDETEGHAFVPQNPEGLYYDHDGNVAADGRWAYTWDGENRLVQMEAWEDLPARARKKLAFTYDWMGRRTGKTVWHWNTSTNGYEQVSSERFAYDGWNLIASLDKAQNPSTPLLQRSFLWGSDLSGSLDGAGGVGGLLLITDEELITAHFPAYDGNGNVTALVDTSGATTATYEYSPFGGLLRCEGEFAAANPVRFSSKFTDDETGLLYYGYRYYTPTLGRWINRDPIEEEGGLNLYGFCLNNGITGFDALGQVVEVLGMSGGQAAQKTAELERANSFKRWARDIVQGYEDFSDIVDLVMDISSGDPTDLLMQLNEKRGDILAMIKNGDVADDDLHHLVPQKLRGKLGKYDVDKFTVGVSKIMHRKLHSGKGYGRGGIWNGLWKAWAGKNGKQADSKDIDEFAQRMADFFGIGGRDKLNYITGK